MTLPIISGGYLAAINYVVGESSCANTMCLRSTVSTDATTVATLLESLWFSSGEVGDLMPSVAQYTKITVTPLDGTSLTTEHDISTHVGGVPTAPATVHSALVVTLRTDHRGRSGRGRLYLGPFTANRLNSDATRWSTTMVTEVETAMSLFQAGLLSNNISLEVLSRKLGTASPVTSIRVNDYIGTIRRRSEREERP